MKIFLQKGIETARTGDKETARNLLEQVVEQDQHNEKAWFWLAAVVDDNEEKRICLNNVLTINPQNTRAQRLLEQLGGPLPSEPLAAAPPPELELFDLNAQPPKSGRSRLPLIILGIIVAAVLIVILLVTLGGGGGKKDVTSSAADGSSTTVAQQAQPPAQSQASPQDETAVSTEVTATAQFAPRATRTTIPTWTPVPTIAPVSTGPATPMASPPPGVSGSIILRTGLVFGDDSNLPISIITADGKRTRMQPTEERGHAPILSPDGTRYAYIRLTTGARENILLVATVNGTDTPWFWNGTPILVGQDTPAWSPDGLWLAFTAVGPGASGPDLYRIAPGGEPEQLTTDEAVESWPSYSPESRFIVYAADITTGTSRFSELRILDLQTRKITDLTTNEGDLAETAPDWSPDGHWVVFEATEKGSNQSDIYRMPADGTEPPEKIVKSPALDKAPRYSPDGRYIVFSSKRTGNWDVFVYDLTSHQIYQITNGATADIANDWGR